MDQTTAKKLCTLNTRFYAAVSYTHLRDDDGVGTVLLDATRHLFVGVDRGLDGGLLPLADRRNDERRVGHGVSGYDAHGNPLS